MSALMEKLGWLTSEHLDSFQDIVVIADESGCVHYFNHTAEQRLGRTAAKTYPGHILEFIDQIDSQNWECLFAEIKQTGPMFCRHKLYLGDGAPKEFEATISPVEISNRTHLLLIFSDDGSPAPVDEPIELDHRLLGELTEHSSDIISLVDWKGRVIYESPTFWKILGYQKGEIIGTNAFSLIHPDDRASLWKQFARGILIPGMVDKATFRLRHKDGSWRWLEGIGKNLLHKPGIRGVLVNSRDVTETRLAEEALKSVEHTYREVFNASGEAILIYDLLKSGFIDVNDTASRLFGYSREELLELPLEALSSDEAEDAGDTSALKVRKATEIGPQIYEWFSRRRDGSCFWTETSLTASMLGGRKCVIFMVRDITARKAAERERLENEVRYRTLFESAGDAILLLKDGVFVDCNSRAYEMFGLDREDIIGQTPAALSPVAQPDGTSSTAMTRLLLGKALGDQVISFEWEHLKGDGSRLPVEVTLTQTTINGETCHQAIVRDVSERKALEEERHAQLERIEAQHAAMLELTTSPVLGSGDVQSAFRELAEVTGRTLDVSRVGIWLLDNDGQDLVCHHLYRHDIDRHEADGSVLRTSECPVYIEALKQGKVLQAPNVFEHPSLVDFYDTYFKEHEIKAMLDVPIRKDGVVIGVLCTENLGYVRDWQQDEVSFAIEICDQIVQVLINSEKKQIERELQLTQHSVDNSPEAAFWVDEAGSVVKVNEPACKFLGYSKEELLGMTVFDWDVKISPEKWKDFWEESKSQDTLTFESIHQRKDGSTYPVEMTTCFVEFQNQEYIFGSARDISARKERERKLRESEEQFQQIAEQVNDLLAIFTTTEYGSHFVNRGWEKLTGLPIEEFYKNSAVWWDLVPAEDRRAVQDRHLEWYDNLETIGREPLVLEYRVHSADGTMRWVRDRTFLIEDEKGKPIRAASLIEDVTERKRDEEELRNSFERLQSFDMHSTEGVYRVDVLKPAPLDLPDEEFIDWVRTHSVMGEANDALAQMYGRRREDIIGLPVMELTPGFGKSTAILLKSGDHRIRNRESKEFDKDGNPFYVIENFHGTIENGCLTSIWGAQRDITERKLAEQALIESEEKFRKFAQTTFEGIAITEDGIVIDANQRWLDMFGRSRDEAVGRSVIEFVHDDDIELIRQRLDLENPPVEVVKCLKKDGSEFIVEVRSDFIEYQGRRCRISALRDITEQQAAQEEIAGSKALLETIIQQAPCGIVVAKSMENGLELSVTNREFRRIFGMDPDSERKLYIENGKFTMDDLPQWRLFKMDGEEIPVGDGPVTRAVLHGAETLSSELEIRIKEVHNLTVLFSAIPLKDSTGQTVGAVGVISDLSEKHRLERQLEHSQKLEMVGQLAGGIAHDFNNFLSAIIGYADLAMLSVEEDAQVRPMLTEIRNAGERASAVTRQLLTFSRGQRLEPMVLNLNQTILDIEKMLSRMIEENIEIFIETDPRMGNVKADPSQIQQILVNLTVNARDAIEGSGKLTIATHGVPQPGGGIPSEVEANPAAWVELTVSDTGSGIDESILDRIFEPFFTTKQSGRGTGLGLATVYGIVKQHSGFIRVKSEIGQGTRFRIFLPRVEDDIEPLKQADVVRDRAPQFSGTVLLVEDEKSVKVLASRLLGQLGFEVIESEEPERAIELAVNSERRIDLLITDVIMPRKNGWEVYQEIKRDRPDIKVLFMSGYTADLLPGNIGELGHRLLKKPFSLSELRQKISEALS